MSENNPLSKYDMDAWRLCNRMYGQPKQRVHHWKRMNKCLNALIKADGDMDKAIDIFLGKDKQ